MLTKRGFVIAYVNILLIAAIVTMAFIKTQSDVAKRSVLQDGTYFPDFIDVGNNITCAGEDDTGDYCGEHGTCTQSWIVDENGDVQNPDGYADYDEWICVCEEGWISYEDRCDYERRPQLNAFLASFFGGGVGADWFYLYVGGNGGYIAAGIFKLLTGGGFSIWWLVDWIRVLTFSFNDSHAISLQPINFGLSDDYDYISSSK